MPTILMDRHWTLDLVALAGVCAGFTLLLTGGAEPLAGVVTAGSAYALLLPELADDPGTVQATATGTAESLETGRGESVRPGPTAR